MSFRDVQFGKEGSPQGKKSVCPSGQLGLRGDRDFSMGRKANRVGWKKPLADGILYGQLRLVPSLSCDTSTNSSDMQPTGPLYKQSTLLDDRMSSCFSLSTTTVPSASLNASLNSPRRFSNPQSGSKARGVPGYTKVEKHRNRVCSGTPKLRGWSHRRYDDIVHSNETATKTSMQSISKSRRIKQTMLAELSRETKHFRVSSFHCKLAHFL